MNILFMASEAFPFIKTGGLADVAGALPRALMKRGHSVHLIVPAYQSLLARIRAGEVPSVALKLTTTLTLEGERVALWRTRLPGTRVTVWLVDIPAFSERSGNPYTGLDGRDWPDNHQRFFRFCQAAVAVATNRAGLNWSADLVHANDWQCGMACWLLRQTPSAPPSVFTIHNLAYHGLFSQPALYDLGLPDTLWQPDYLEFYGQLSFIKAGLVFAHRLTTVSPGYAREIQTPDMGHGLDGLLRARHDDLSGILNGIDTEVWHPGRDRYLATPYNQHRLQRKSLNTADLRKQLGLTMITEQPLVGFVGRMVAQKGLDLLLAVLPEYLQKSALQLVVLGKGDPHYEQAFAKLALTFPDTVSVTLGYDEALAHRIEAGADLFLMPSLFEPCGLNQLYSLRYGALPLVHAVGGLGDTVVDEGNPVRDNGFCFHRPQPDALSAALSRALEMYEKDTSAWRQRQRNAMGGDYSWNQSAAAYDQLYQKTLSSV
ncbi:glycogen synthase GlgA [Marinimicrobium sp. ARAG 43.8]|uniref:glycogen synthase GlgA n=1 Tax=Marinimicrobium sp. ARAG 43.8 TaxID=3418719 RepID=UPI003CE68BBF